MHRLSIPRPLLLQLLDGLHDPRPHPLAANVALVQEFVGAHGGFGGRDAALEHMARVDGDPPLGGHVEADEIYPVLIRKVPHSRNGTGQDQSDSRKDGHPASLR